MPDITNSTRLLDESDRILVRGCQGHKRSHEMVTLGYPVFARRAQGGSFEDVDGNTYLDFLLGFGPILLGYNDPVVNQAIRQQLEEGTVYTVAHPLELEVAQRLISLIPGVEKVCFHIGGSGATSGALRLARTFTGRSHVIRCGYHGWHDWTQPGGAGVPAEIGQLTLAVPYGNLNAAEELFRQYPGKIACWILEAQQDDGPPEGYLQQALDLCHEHGALMVFDEIKVGFRMAWGGAGQIYGVTPDLATFGKACCNGYPASFVGGRREILDQCNDAWLAATFHCDMLSLVALDTVISEMQRRDGFAYLHRLGTTFMEGMNQAAANHDIAWTLVGSPAMPTPKLADESQRGLIHQALRYCLDHGVYLHPGHPMFLCLAHTSQDIERTVNLWHDALARR